MKEFQIYMYNHQMLCTACVSLIYILGMYDSSCIISMLWCISIVYGLKNYKTGF